MCQRFFLWTVIFFMSSCVGLVEVPAPSDQVFIQGPGGFTTIRVVNNGRTSGWIDIVNQTGSKTSSKGYPVILINYERTDRPSFILDSFNNSASRKFNFKGVRNIACFVFDKNAQQKQVNCNDVVSIPYYYPQAFTIHWDDLKLEE